MTSFFIKRHLIWIICIFVLYLLLNVWLSGFYNTLPLILAYANTVNWWKLSFSLLFTLIIGALVSLNSVSLFVHYRQRKECKKESFFAGIGGVGGLAVGVCPLCVVGLFPLILSALGISFSFGILPFQGLEIQIFVIILLSISLYMLELRKV